MDTHLAVAYREESTTVTPAPRSNEHPLTLTFSGLVVWIHHFIIALGN